MPSAPVSDEVVYQNPGSVNVPETVDVMITDNLPNFGQYETAFIVNNSINIYNYLLISHKSNYKEQVGFAVVGIDAIEVIKEDWSPDPAFTATVDCQKISFTPTETETLSTFHSWNFGDGTTSSETSPMHYYLQPGIYTVTHTVTNTCGVP